MSPQHHFFVVFLELFFFSSLLLVPPPLFVKYQQVLERRRRRRRWRGDSRGSCVPRPSRLSVHLTLSPHLLQFWLPLVCLSICICVSSPSFSSVPLFQWRGGWGMISQALMPLAPALAFPQHMSPGNYEALLADCYYSVMLLSGVGGRRGGGGEEASPSGVIGKVIK